MTELWDGEGVCAERTEAIVAKEAIAANKRVVVFKTRDRIGALFPGSVGLWRTLLRRPYASSVRNSVMSDPGSAVPYPTKGAKPSRQAS